MRERRGLKASFLQHAFSRSLIVTQSEKYWGSQFWSAALRSSARPLSEFDFGDQLGLDPTHPPQGIDFPEKRILGCLRFLQYLPNLAQRLLVEAASRLSYVNQPLLLVIEAKYDRTKVRAGPFRLRISADDTLDALADLDLEPLASAALLIATGTPLGDNALQSFVACDLKQRLAAFLVVVGVAYPV